MIDKFEGEYAFLSNFYDCPVNYGLTYRNCEAAFQAMKDPNRCTEFVDLHASRAKALGRKVRLRSDWEEIKDTVMLDILRAKFDTNPDLKEKLLATGDEFLVEGNTWGDTYWGVCNGKGRNHLGHLLMQVRDEFARSERK